MPALLVASATLSASDIPELSRFWVDLSRLTPRERPVYIKHYASRHSSDIIYSMIEDLRSEKDDSKFCVYSMVVVQLDAASSIRVLKKIRTSPYPNDRVWAKEFLIDIQDSAGKR